MTGPPTQAPQAGQPATTPGVQLGGIPEARGRRTVVFGPGGIGKSSLALLDEGPIAVVDLDESLPDLRGQLAPETLAKIKVVQASTWQEIRDALHAPGWDGIKTIVIDSVTRLEELATEWVLANVAMEKGGWAQRVEDFGYKAGYRHIYDTFLHILGDLDQHVRADRNVTLVAHDCTEQVVVEDYVRYEPRLQSGKGGKYSIRYRVRDWAAHMFFVGYDVVVKKGKATGSGTRTIWPAEMPHCMAKSRTLSEPMEYIKGDDSLWQALREGA